MSKELKVILVAGARPNFMKIAPLISAIRKFNNSIDSGERKSQVAREQGVNKIDPISQTNPTNPRDSYSPLTSSEALLQPPTIPGPINYVLVHTGQHYDLEMSETFFREFGLPSPDFHLEVGSASHALQTANIMIRFEEACLKEKPDWVLVVGDVNSTMACTLVAAKMSIKVAHVEAGLRSFDRTMPEEINRVVTDAVSDLLFTPSEDADENLLREGILAAKIKRVGNIMIDTLIAHLDKARCLRPYDRFQLKEKDYVFVTLHRPSNVDNKASLSIIMDSFTRLSKRLPIIFPVHPRTRKSLIQFGLWNESSNSNGLILSEPLGYHDTIGLVDKARFVLTDSGGLQEETTFLNVPCLTLRPNTERPVTLTQGTNKLTCLDSLDQDIEKLINGSNKNGRIPELWDGHTAERIIKILAELNSQKMDLS
jgi:UDP-N-acetylglucosamine 2-epimerase (non-hydrolysing)